jgi:Bacterial membrane protein YfhO
VFLSISHVSIVKKLNDLIHTETQTRSALKKFFDSLNYHDVVVLNGIIQIIFLGILYVLLKKSSRQMVLSWIFILNSFVFAQLNIPYTLVSKTSPQIINNFIKSSPAGFPIPDQTKSIASNSANALAHFKEIGIGSFYDKNIATVDTVFTPTFMTQMERVYADSSVRNTVLSHPYAFFANPHLATSFELKEFWNNGFRFNTNTNDTSVFYLQQLYLPGWKGFIDNRKQDLFKVNSAFMATRIPKGRHEVKFIYQPNGIIFSLILSLFSFLVVFGLLLKNILRANKKW